MDPETNLDKHLNVGIIANKIVKVTSEKLTGGTILEKNCHHFDLFNWMLGTPPVRVAAMGGRNVLTTIPGGRT